MHLVPPPAALGQKLGVLPLPQRGSPQAFQQSCSSVGSSAQGSTGPCMEAAPARASHGLTSFFSGIPLFQHRLLQGLQAALTPGAAPAPPSALPWVSAELFLSHVPNLLFSAPERVRKNFFFLESIIPGVSLPSPVGLVLVSCGSVQKLVLGLLDMGKFLAASHKSYLCGPVVPKPGHTNPVHLEHGSAGPRPVRVTVNHPMWVL